MMFRAIVGFQLVTADPARLAAFYQALGFDIGNAAPIPATELELLSLQGVGSRITMSLGPSRVDIDCFEQQGRPYPGDATACDLLFQHLALVTEDVRAAWLRAREVGAAPISREGPVTLPKSAGHVTAVKFRDPDGHTLPNSCNFRLVPIPAGKVSASWGSITAPFRCATSRPASVSTHVSACAKEKRLYNHGPTQDALDGLDGVKVDVAPMNPADTPPHLELLGYRHPAGRRLSPLAANDIAATRIVWRSDREALIHDPDGHLHQLSR